VARASGKALTALCLGLLVALFARTPTQAAAPPPAPPAEDVARFDGGDFKPEPPAATAAVVGAAAAPVSGRLAALGLLAAGEGKLVWRRLGTMASLHGRMRIGTAGLFLNGFHAGLPGGVAALGELATLKAGDQFGCWGLGLHNTDRFRAVPREWLLNVEDGEAIGIGTAEAVDYSKVLILANYTSRKAFARAVRRDLSYAHLFNDPATSRGKVVRVTGRLKLVKRFDPPPEAAREGYVNDLYEAWVFDETQGQAGYCVVFTEWSAGLPRSLLEEKKIARHVVVSFDGYFFKKLRYQAADKRARVAAEVPLLIGHGLNVISVDEPAAGQSDDGWAGALGALLVGLLGATLVGVLGLTWWFRRADRRVRERLRLARRGEFVLPTPDATPVAAPVGAPARSIALARPVAPAAGRVTDRRGPARGPDAGFEEKGGAGPDTPDEEAGA
jgi:hypothetical protein